jgi:hypothetical protein
MHHVVLAASVVVLAVTSFWGVEESTLVVSDSVIFVPQQASIQVDIYRHISSPDEGMSYGSALVVYGARKNSVDISKQRRADMLEHRIRVETDRLEYHGMRLAVYGGFHLHRMNRDDFVMMARGAFNVLMAEIGNLSSEPMEYHLSYFLRFRFDRIDYLIKLIDSHCFSDSRLTVISPEVVRPRDWTDNVYGVFNHVTALWFAHQVVCFLSGVVYKLVAGCVRNMGIFRGDGFA